MMELEDFKKNGHELIDWIADYFQNLENFPVKPNINPGDIIRQLPDNAPENAEDFNNIFNDFKNIIFPGLTLWQHPKFFAYFPASNSLPSILGELLTASLGVQAMSWETSPAATELEELVMSWLRSMFGLPTEFTGVIQDSASTATLCTILTARELYSKYQINLAGFSALPSYKVYCSTEAHSSIEKAVKIAGLGVENLRKIPADSNYSMKIDELEKAIRMDLRSLHQPICVIAAAGTTSSTGFDNIEQIAKICKKYKVWLHVDAAYAGTALLLPEKRDLFKGIEHADSIVINPHKWMLTNFDCSAYFIKNKSALIKTFEIMPEYLKTKVDDHVNNYRDWSIQLGRRFRALKLWFVIRSYGIEGLQAKLRHQIELAEKLKVMIESNPNFQILAPMPLNLICFRLKPENIDDNKLLNQMNEELLQNINKTGKVYLSHTKLNKIFTLRIHTGSNLTEEKHINEAYELIEEESRKFVITKQ